jgi:hypothetical protein
MSHLVPSLSEPLVKLDRAREHLATLRAELEAFMSERPHPYAIVAQKYPDEPVYAHRQIAPVGLRVRITINPDTFPPGVKEPVVPFQDGHMLGIFPEELIDDRERALKIEPSFDVLSSKQDSLRGSEWKHSANSTTTSETACSHDSHASSSSQ